MDYTTKTIIELKVLCKERKIKGISGKTKSALIAMLDTIETEKETELRQDVSATPLNLTDMLNKVSYGECVDMMKKISSNSIDIPTSIVCSTEAPSALSLAD